MLKLFLFKSELYGVNISMNESAISVDLYSSDMHLL